MAANLDKNKIAQRWEAARKKQEEEQLSGTSNMVPYSYVEEALKQHTDTTIFRPKYDEIVANENNEMSITQERIEELAENIRLVGLLTPLTAVRLPDYSGIKIISGETRYRAIGLLRKRGQWREDDTVDVRLIELNRIDLPLEDLDKEMYLLLSGNLNREKTDADRAFEVRKWMDLVDKLRANGVETFVSSTGPVQISGRKTREIIAEQTGMSSRQVSNYKKIETTGSDELKNAMRDELISVKVAAQVAGMPQKEQDAFIEQVKEQGETNTRVTMEDLEQFKEKRAKRRPSVRINYTAENWAEDTKSISELLSRMDNLVFNQVMYDKIKKKIEEIEKVFGLR